MPVQTAVTNPKTIVLKGELSEKHDEYPADAALYPGHLVKINSDGECLKQATASVQVKPLFAKEQEFLGNGITVAYAAGDLVPVHYAQPGDRIYARYAASATAVVIGDPLTPSNDGTLKKGNGTTDFTIAYAAEAVDNSAGSGEVFGRVDIK